MSDLLDQLGRGLGNGLRREAERAGGQILNQGIRGAIGAIQGPGATKYQSLDGMSAQAKANLQQQLRATGDYNGPIDGDFGPGSQAAFNNFAAKNGKAGIVKQNGETYLPADTIRALGRAGRRGEVSAEEEIDTAQLNLSKNISAALDVAPEAVAQAPATPTAKKDAAAQGIA